MAEIVPHDEIRSRGYLLEVNRRFFHPLGLALAIVKDGSGSHLEVLRTDDPEGWVMGEWTQEDIDHAWAVQGEMEAGLARRWPTLGFGIESVPQEPG